MGTTRSFTATPNASAVPTARIGGTCMKRIKTGAVMMPAPTPVMPMATAIKNPSRISMALFAGNMDSALQLAPAPAPGSEILRIDGQRRAGLATDAGVAFFVQRQNGNAAPLQIGPNVRIRPRCQRTHLEQWLSAGQAELIQGL